MTNMSLPLPCPLWNSTLKTAFIVTLEITKISLRSHIFDPQLSCSSVSIELKKGLDHVTFGHFLKIKLTLKGTEICHHRRYAEKVAQDLEVNPKEVLQPQME